MTVSDAASWPNEKRRLSTSSVVGDASSMASVGSKPSGGRYENRSLPVSVSHSASRPPAGPAPPSEISTSDSRSRLASASPPRFSGQSAVAAKRSTLTAALVNASGVAGSMKRYACRRWSCSNDTTALPSASLGQSTASASPAALPAGGLPSRSRIGAMTPPRTPVSQPRRSIVVKVTQLPMSLTLRNRPSAPARSPDSPPNRGLSDRKTSAPMKRSRPAVVCPGSAGLSGTATPRST